MITTTSLLPNGDFLVTFMIDDEHTAPVAGDTDGWDHFREPFVEEVDGRRYVTVSLPADTVACFRSLALAEFYEDDAPRTYDRRRSARRLSSSGNGPPTT